MRDELQLIKDVRSTNSANKPIPLNFITNLHTSNQKGVHWSAGTSNKNGDNYYFDSYENSTYK